MAHFKDITGMRMIALFVFESTEIDGPEYLLHLFDLYQRDEYGKMVLGYEFFCDSKLIFEGQDFHLAPGASPTSNECAAHLLTFLSLRPGDTDDEYFEDYTPAQLEFAELHGEDLAMIAMELEENNG